MADEKSKGNYITQAWLVITLALLYGAALAGIHIGLSPKIAENRKNETYGQIPNLVEGAVTERTKEHKVTTVAGKEIIVYEAIDANNNRVGWVLPGSGQGFADAIDVLVGVDPELNVITGMFVLGQKETPGLGDYITDGSKFRDQFKSKLVDPPLIVVKSNPNPDHEIQSLTGATVSSEAVSKIVNDTIAGLKPAILEIQE
jgi:electron transport complex protein RnfG